MMSCHVEIAKEAAMRDRTIITRPKQEAERRNRGHLWRTGKRNGADKYMIPDAVVGIAAIPEGSFENGSCVE